MYATVFVSNKNRQKNSISIFLTVALKFLLICRRLIHGQILELKNTELCSLLNKIIEKLAKKYKLQFLFTFLLHFIFWENYDNRGAKI